MVSFELSGSLGGTTTTVPEHFNHPFNINGIQGFVPVTGNTPALGTGFALNGRRTFLKLTDKLSLTGGVGIGGDLGAAHSSLFGSGFAGLRFAPTTPQFHLDVDAGYNALKINTPAVDTPLYHGGLLALGAMGQLNDLWSLGLRGEVAITPEAVQGRLMINLGIAFGETAVTDTKVKTTKSAAENYLEIAEQKLNLVKTFFGKDIHACISEGGAPTIGDIDQFLQIISADGDQTDCNLPGLGKTLQNIQDDLASAQRWIGRDKNSGLQERLNAIQSNLQTVNVIYAKKAIELLMAPQNSALVAVMNIAKSIQEDIILGKIDKANTNLQRYENALTQLKATFDKAVMSSGQIGPYEREESIISCLTSEKQCPAGINPDLSLPSLKRKLGGIKGK